MNDNPSSVPTHFDSARADAYDNQFAALQPIKDAAHLLIQAQFAGLPANARILIAGAGTGAEVRFLAPPVSGLALHPH